MPKSTPERIIDRPFGQARRASTTIPGTGAAAVTAHNHDDRYYTKSLADAELTAALAVLDLNDLADVDLASAAPTDGQALIYDDATDTWIAGTVADGTVAWDDITGKPSTFTPATHAHAWADITSGLPDYTTRWPTWTEVTSKPTTFTPASHAHVIADTTGLQAALDAKAGLALANVFTEDQTVGTNAANKGLFLNGPVATVRQVGFQTAGVDRWFFRVSTAAESGSNVGSEFVINRRADDGSNLGDTFMIKRNTGHLLLNTATDLAQLTIKADSAGTIGIVVDTPASPTAAVVKLSRNTTDRWSQRLDDANYVEERVSQVAVANDAVISLPSGAIGFLDVINATNNSMARFALHGSDNEVIELYDSGQDWLNPGAGEPFNTTKDTADCINVYYDSGYKLQNKTGASASLAIRFTGAATSL